MNIIKLNWIIYSIASFVLFCGIFAFLNGTIPASEKMMLKTGESVEVRYFRLFRTPLQIEIVIKNEDLERRRREMNIEAFPAECLKHVADPSYLHYVQEMAEPIRFEIEINGDNDQIVFDDSAAHDAHGYGACGVFGVASEITKRISLNQELSRPADKFVEIYPGWTTVMLDAGWSRLKIKATEVGPILSGDRSEVSALGPIDIKHGSGVVEWDDLTIFIFWPVYIVIDLAWLLVLILVTRRRPKVT